MQAVQPNPWRLRDELLTVGRGEKVTGEARTDLVCDVGGQGGDVARRRGTVGIGSRGNEGSMLLFQLRVQPFHVVQLVLEGECEAPIGDAAGEAAEPQQQNSDEIERAEIRSE